MESRSKKYMSTALLLFLSSQANLLEAQEYNKVDSSSQSDLPMATVIYNDEIPGQSTLSSSASTVQKQHMSAPITVPVESIPVSYSGDQQAMQVEEEERIDADGRVFGYRNGYVHASLGLRGEWSDNLYNTDTEKEENFLTTISPSVWVTWPRRSRRPFCRLLRIIPQWEDCSTVRMNMMFITR